MKFILLTLLVTLSINAFAGYREIKVPVSQIERRYTNDSGESILVICHLVNISGESQNLSVKYKKVTGVHLEGQIYNHPEQDVMVAGNNNFTLQPGEEISISWGKAVGVSFSHTPFINGEIPSLITFRVNQDNGAVSATCFTNRSASAFSANNFFSMKAF